MSDRAWQRLDEMPYLLGQPQATGIIRQQPEDFLVDEILGFEPDGEGEHWMLHIQKRNSNTAWVGKQLARLAGVPPRDTSYAGLKDRHAVTTQWFSVWLPGKEAPDWQQINSDEIKLLAAIPHSRKLRTGTLQGNRFRLMIRQLKGDKAELESRLKRIAKEGVPNYFGEQRFGHDYDNLTQASRLFRGELTRLSRHLRGLYLSATRSQLFNQVVAARIDDGSWNRALPGDQMMLQGCHSLFAVETVDESLEQRVEALDCHPTGPMWGRGRVSSSLEVEALENRLLAPFEEWRDGLEWKGLKQDRRPLRVKVGDLTWQFADEYLQLDFTLQAGSYATMVLRELLRVEVASAHE
ncbi:MAG: tRNA pseudouridine(13) synthase TruD [Candidatus Polarisedimenticolaceae bacterium]|nr:tRNA pseudouridine(13) synthase TruD [Candidatus Polarisedimenticolaceae bacterium]